MPRFQNSYKASRGFTLIELLIVIGVIVVLIALLLPSVASVRARARSAEAQSNLAQLGLARSAASRNRGTPVMHQDSDGTLWTKQIQPFLEGENEALFVNPADPNAEMRGPNEPSFAANNQMHRMGSGDGKKIVILDFEEKGLPREQDGVFEAAPDSNGDPWTDEVDGNWQNALDAAGQRQGGNVNVLRHDGSVSSESAQDLMDYHPQNSPEDWVPWRTDNQWICPDGQDCSPPDALANDLTPDVPVAPPGDPPSEGGGGGGGGGGEYTNGDDEEEDGEDTVDGEDTQDSTPLEDEGCYQHGLGFPEVANLHVRSEHKGHGTGDGLVGPLRLDPNHPRFKFVSMGDCNGYELWYEDWDDDDYDMHFRFQRIRTGPNAGKIQLSVRFYTEAKAHYYLYLDENRTPFPDELAHYCNWSGYQTCGDNEKQLAVGEWFESTVLFEGDLERPCTCPPAVDAGADVSIPSLEYQLLGDASVDSTTGLPSQVYWTQVSGPEGVAFSDPTTLQPTAHFPGEGVYVLKLTGTADGKSSSDEIQVSIDSEATLYRYVRVKRVAPAWKWSNGGVFLASVKIINNEGTDVAPMGMASCTTNGRAPENAISHPGCDRNTGCYQGGQQLSDWWMVELAGDSTIDTIEIENTCSSGYGKFLKGVQVEALDENQTVIWTSDTIGSASDGSNHTFNP